MVQGKCGRRNKLFKEKFILVPRKKGKSSQYLQVSLQSQTPVTLKKGQIVKAVRTEMFQIVVQELLLNLFRELRIGINE
jgi:phage terminase large subunit-like protein